MASAGTRPPRVIAIFGSGETSPSMTSVHQKLMARVSQPRLNAIFLDTTFGFQENADEIAARTIAYFRQHVGCEISPASFRHRDRVTGLQFEQFLGSLAEANYVFAGPGSPTYALRHWRDARIHSRFIEKVTRGGCIAFASAAAIALGAYALPVYEIYKVGEDPSWTEGLDVLGAIGVRCAVIPHYDNREGGTHDTRYSYIGDRRLRLLESMLPDDVLILGVDEHTVGIIDIEARSVTVRGRGGVTIRRRGVERLWKRTTFPLSELWDPACAPVLDSHPEAAVTAGDGATDRVDVQAVLTAVLEMDHALHEWMPDGASADDRDRVRAEIRKLVVGLGDLAHLGGRDHVRVQVAPLVDLLLSLRGEARREQRFNDADRLRAILAQCGVEVADTPSGPAWNLAEASPAGVALVRAAAGKPR